MQQYRMDRLDFAAQCFFAALFGYFRWNDRNTLIEQSPALKYSNRAVKNVSLTIPPETHIDGL